MNTLTRENAVSLVEWYETNKRDLPWRRTKDPYAVWLSEIMLQQTRIEAATEHYLRFLEALPSLKDLADCPEDRLMKLWQGLGYYQRARNLQKCAQTLISSGKDTLPASYEELRALPGIGPYTAGAVSSIAFGIPAPAVDGNVLRVLARLFADPADIRAESTKHAAEHTIAAFYTTHPDLSSDPSFVSSFTQGLMELGALVCIPNGTPHCSVCPWQKVCSAYDQNRTDVIPFRSVQQRRRSVPMTVFVIFCGDRVLLHQRADHGLLAGLYEFPNTEGHLSAEDSTAYLQEMGYDVVSTGSLPGKKHIFTHREWDMSAQLVHVSTDSRIPKDIIPVPAEMFDTYAVPSAFDIYVSEVKKLWTRKRGTGNE